MFGYTFLEEKIRLQGQQALDYVRMRKDDPLGDFGRQHRQKQVIQSLLKKGANFNLLLRKRNGTTSNY